MFLLFAIALLSTLSNADERRNLQVNSGSLGLKACVQADVKVKNDEKCCEGLVATPGEGFLAEINWCRVAATINAVTQMTTTQAPVNPVTPASATTTLLPVTPITSAADTQSPVTSVTPASATTTPLPALPVTTSIAARPVTEAPPQCTQSSWTDIKNNVKCDDCKALVSSSVHKSCHDFCQAQEGGLSCVGAFEDLRDTCEHSRTYRCKDDLRKITADMLCQCAKKESVPCHWVGFETGKHATGTPMNFAKGDSKKTTASAVVCKELCENLTECNGVEYNISSGECHIFSGVAGLHTPNSENISTSWCAPTTETTEETGTTNKATTTDKATPTDKVNTETTDKATTDKVNTETTDKATTTPTDKATITPTDKATTTPTDKATTTPGVVTPTITPVCAANGAHNPNSQFYLSHRGGCPTKKQMIENERECEAAASVTYTQITRLPSG